MSTIEKVVGVYWVLSILITTYVLVKHCVKNGKLENSIFNKLADEITKYDLGLLFLLFCILALSPLLTILTVRVWLGDLLEFFKGLLYVFLPPKENPIKINKNMNSVNNEISPLVQAIVMNVMAKFDDWVVGFDVYDKWENRRRIGEIICQFKLFEGDGVKIHGILYKYKEGNMLGADFSVDGREIELTHDEIKLLADTFKTQSKLHEQAIKDAEKSFIPSFLRV